VRVGLVANIPDKLVLRRVEHVMQCDCQFHDAEAGAQMAAGNRDDIDCLLAQFIGELAQAPSVERPQLVGLADAIKQWRFGG